MVFVSSVVVLPSALIGTASAASLVHPSPASAGVKHWLGTWSGKVSQTPAPPPGDPQNPYKIIISINSVTKHKVGTVRYPAWKCNYALTRVSVSSNKLQLTMTVINRGPFNCLSAAGAKMQSTAKGASWRLTGGGVIETGPLTKNP
jgi:hypothetical protein